MILYNEASAIFLIRVFLGILFFWQGYDKVFNIKISGVIKTFEHPLIEKHFPKFILSVSAYYTSYIELVGGFLLVIGLSKQIVLLLLGIDLLMVSVAFSIIKPMWDLQQVFVRLLLIAVLLLAPSHWDIVSLDYLISLKKI